MKVDFAKVRVYLVTDPRLNGGRDEETVIRQAVARGGVDLVQFRSKHLTKREYFAQAAHLAGICREIGVPLLLNDHVDIAALVDCDGIHVGQSDLPPSEVRKLLGPDKTIGLSTHTVEQALAAQDSGADYINIGPVFATATKDTPVVPVGLEMVRAVAAISRLPVTTMGGIKHANAADVVLAGADRVAVVTAITEAADIAEAAATLKSIVEGARQGRGPL